MLGAGGAVVDLARLFAFVAVTCSIAQVALEGIGKLSEIVPATGQAPKDSKLMQAPEYSTGER